MSRSGIIIHTTDETKITSWHLEQLLLQLSLLLNESFSIELKSVLVFWYNLKLLAVVEIKSNQINLFTLDNVTSGCPISWAEGSCIKRASTPDQIWI